MNLNAVKGDEVPGTMSPMAATFERGAEVDPRKIAENELLPATELLKAIWPTALTKKLWLAAAIVPPVPGAISPSVTIFVVVPEEKFDTNRLSGPPACCAPNPTKFPAA